MSYPSSVDCESFFPSTAFAVPVNRGIRNLKGVPVAIYEFTVRRLAYGWIVPTVNLPPSVISANVAVPEFCVMVPVKFMFPAKLLVVTESATTAPVKVPFYT
jgi:hypothetical protein